MGAPLTFNGRLPGVVCETALPPQENPLRLDVAGFVGFAERGPLDVAVAVEDSDQYRAVFGNDLPLARSLQGQAVFASMPEAVRAFFDNGGRRCYVVRVAGEGADFNRFRIPGMVVWDEENETFKTVVAPAAWKGSWSDDMSVGTQIESLPLALRTNPIEWPDGPDGGPVLHLELPTITMVQQGDLLRLHFAGTGRNLSHPYGIYSVACTQVETRVRQNGVMVAPLQGGAGVQQNGVPATMPRGVRVTVKLRPNKMPAFSTKDKSALLPEPIWVERLTETGWEFLSFIEIDSLKSEQVGRNVEYILTLKDMEAMPTTEAGLGTSIIEVGDLLRVVCVDGEELLFPVVDVRQQGFMSESSPPEPTYLQVFSRGALWQYSAGAMAGARAEPSHGGQTGAITFRESSPPMEEGLGDLVQVDLLSFDLYVREDEEVVETWSDVRFGNVPNSYWVDKLVPSPGDLQAEILSGKSQRKVPGLDATRSSRLGVPLPISDGEDAQSALFSQSSSSGDCTQVGDDAKKALPWFYLPLGMADLPSADEFAGPLPDEASMVSKNGLESFDDPIALFLDERLADVGANDLVNTVNELLYVNPVKDIEPLRKLHSLFLIDEVGLIALPDLAQRRWGPPEPGPGDVPEPLPPPPSPRDWSHFENCELPPPGGEPSPPKGLPGQVDPLKLLPVVETADEYQPVEMDLLLYVQRALVRLCSARADVLAVLSLPFHFKRREVLEWQRRFTTETQIRYGTGADTIFENYDLSYYDQVGLSYGAVYHPWLQVREEVRPDLAPLRSAPPDGAVCGMIAARELARGPWIAPANVPLLGVVGLDPVISTNDWTDLFNAQVNVVRQQPGQFTLMSAHTLSLDSLLLQISVRRLLIFLRKLAFRRGMRYVFEVNNERFRQRVQASFENTLATMATRGALTAFEVVTSSEINTPNDYDNGRFLIALKVAPTQPVEFITVVLLRAGEGLLEVIER